MNQEITERTFEFAVRIVKLCQFLEEKPGVSRVLAQQLLRSGTSIGANVEEARAGQSKADFIHKNAIALKEARETHYWLRLLVATEIIPQHKLNTLLQEADELQRILGAILVSSKTSKK
jgi:four helix bundle protein